MPTTVIVGIVLQAPGLSFSLPKDYETLPRLIGRAVVELTVEKADASLAFVDNVNGGLAPQGKVRLCADSQPVSRRHKATVLCVV